MPDRPRAPYVVPADRDVRVEEVLPGKSTRGPRFELGEVDVAEREHAQCLEERPGSVVEREGERGLVGRPQRLRLTRDHDEPRDVVLEVLDSRLEDRQIEDL